MRQNAMVERNAGSFVVQEKKRLSKALAAAGVASRRACEDLIFQGHVKVNGQIVRVPQTLVSFAIDRIEVDDTPIQKEEEKVTFLLNKPYGYVCSHENLGTKKRVIDLFRHLPYRLFTVGRLDRDTTGLLIITNDGHLAQRIIHPSANICKEYLVKVEQEISGEHLKAISKGMFIEGFWMKPLRAQKVRKGTLKIIVKEGKKHEVRLFVQNARLTILTLSRIRIGGLLLGPLQEGTFRECTQADKKRIFSQNLK
jgi:23S rRNA pseudouridine2605 synthase